MQPTILTAQQVKQGWDLFAPKYAELLERPNLQLGQSLSRMLRIQEAQNILEIGCGTGRLALENARILPSGSKYYAVDISDEMIKIAQQRKEATLKTTTWNDGVDVQFSVCDGENISFIADESMDVVIAPLCIHLTPDPNNLLKEALRVLKKGGRIGFSVLGTPENSTFFTLVSNQLKKAQVSMPQVRSVFYLGKKDILIKLAQDNGINIDFCWTDIVTMDLLEEVDVEEITKTPSNAKTLASLDEETRAKVIQGMKDEFNDRKKNFNPLQTENVLLTGRKPE